MDRNQHTPRWMFLLNAAVSVSIFFGLFVIAQYNETHQAASWAFLATSILLATLYGGIILQNIADTFDYPFLKTRIGSLLGHTFIVLGSTYASVMFGVWNLGKAYRY